jgi:tRNA (cmo5U34)-methyltransferase
VSAAPDNERIRKGFNRLAPAYDLLAGLFFGGRLLRSQTHFLPELKKCRSALILGGGTGAILQEMAKLGIAERYTYVDISDRMIGKAEKRMKGKGHHIEFIRGSYTAIPAQAFDLIVTPYVLDCFREDELGLVIQTLSEKFTPGGEWLFVDFQVPDKKMKVARPVIRLLYFFFNITSGLGVTKLPDFQRIFSAQQFRIKKEKEFLGGLLQAKIYSRP